ncbi:MAG: hypothetical protein N3D85_07915, partial [Candidatus Bathyarchaeota archaeon]|nr:hypothetical protein [Candidatus Bathyarchaeota archaeon]
IIVFLTGVVLLGIYPALYLLMREVTSTKIVGTSYGLLLSLGMLSGILSVSVGGALMELSPYFVYVLGSIIALLGTMISTRLKH